jgi:hypothetical protein
MRPAVPGAATGEILLFASVTRRSRRSESARNEKTVGARSGYSAPCKPGNRWLESSPVPPEQERPQGRGVRAADRKEPRPPAAAA